MKREFIRKSIKTGAAVFLVTVAAGSLHVSAASEDTGITPGIYEICSAEDDDFVLDQPWCSETGAFSEKQDLQMYRSLDVNQQKFYVEQLPSSGYRITGLTSGEVLTIEEGEVVSPDAQLQEEAEAEAFEPVLLGISLEPLEEEARKEAPETQIWHLEKIAGSSYYIRSESGAYLTREENITYNGEVLCAAARTGKKNQRWILKKAWIGSEEHADTDYINPYAEDGRSENLSLSMYFGSDQETITSEMLASWIKEEEHSADLDREQLTAYVQSLAERHNTVGQPRSFTTSYGNTITLYKGDFGWKLNVSSTVEELSANLTGRSPKTVEPVWSQKGGVLKGSNDIGDSYVEVDLINQKVWLYKDGEQILETDCVTGTYGTSRQTPGGVYDINGKQSPAVLRGADYASPVSYWMPFNGGIGLHDATWRSTFGGEIFRTNGSHGCVNLPLDAAEIIYETVTIGYPVVCYN